MDILQETQLSENLEELIEQKDFSGIKTLLSDQQPVDLALLFDEIDDEMLPIVFRLLPKDIASDTFIEMDPQKQEDLIVGFSDKELKEIVDDLFLDDTVDLIEEMPAHIVRKILKNASAATRADINTMLNYPRDSAGTIMTNEFVTLKSSMTVEKAFERIRKTGVDKETIYTCYVTDEVARLIGVVSARTLLLSDKQLHVGDIMEDNIIFASTTDDKENVAREIEKYSLLSIPVVDAERRLVGIVTIDDAMDILREENTEDITKIAAILPSEKPYFKTSVIRLFLARLPWLLILMVTATISGLIISQNESILSGSAAGIILTACIPMIMGTGGNAGSQASVTIIRGIALGEIRFRDMFRVMFKEFRVAILTGLSLAVATFVKLMLVERLGTAVNGYMIALAICLSMFATVVIAKFIGCCMPLLAKKFRLDPAVIASPFISTIVDSVSLLIYCNIAIALLP